MNIGLTGSTGVLGTLLKKKFKLKKKNLFLNKIQNLNDVNNWIKSNNFDCIIHLAAIVPTEIVKKNKHKANLVNFKGTKNLVNAINSFSRKKVWFFYSSTSHIYKPQKNFLSEKSKKKPMTYYGQTKLKSENYILSNKKNISPCIGRIFSFTSNKQNSNFIIPSIIKKLKSKNKKIFFENLNHERDFLPLEDIVSAINKLLYKNYEGIINICSNRSTNLTDILFALNDKYKKEIYLKENKNKTYLLGSNKKLLKLGWKLNNYNYLNYLHKNF
jgi:nucleoside-diphosphate-sugar epimerase